MVNKLAKHALLFVIALPVIFIYGWGGMAIFIGGSSIILTYVFIHTLFGTEYWASFFIGSFVNLILGFLFYVLYKITYEIEEYIPIIGIYCMVSVVIGCAYFLEPKFNQ